MERLPEPHADPSDDQPDGPTGWRSRLPLIIWVATVSGLLAAIFLGSVSVVSYRYNAFTSRLTRDVLSSTYIEVWTEQIENLPEASDQWATTALFVGSAVIVLAGVIYGAWLLLVSSHSVEGGLTARPVRRNGDR